MEPIQVALLEHLEQLVSSDKTYQNITDIPVYIAYSGGLDSSVLFHAAVQLFAKNKISSLTAAHVNHGLQPENHDWQRFCLLTCQQYQIALKVKELNLACDQDLSENAARTARYEFFEELMKDSGVMMFAHHQGDQAETLLFRIARGCGIHGLTGIPAQRTLGKGFLLRPLLAFNQQQLRDYASKYQIDWVEDPSNQTDHYARNYLRNQIIPALKVKWPSVQRSLHQLSQVAADQVEILDEIAAQDLEFVFEKVQIISIEKLKALSQARKKNVIHYWVKQQSGSSPSSSEIGQLINQIQSNSLQSLEVKTGCGWIRGYDNKLFYRSQLEPCKLLNSFKWTDIESPLELENGLILSYSQWQEDPNNKELRLRKPTVQETVTVTARIGGEIAKPKNRTHSTELKKIYQELKIPSWERVWLPIIYYNDQIAAVPGVFVEQAFSVDEGGYTIQLKRSDTQKQ